MADPLQFALSIIEMKQRQEQRDAELNELKRQHEIQNRLAERADIRAQASAGRDEAESAARLKQFEQARINATNNTIRDFMGGQTVFVPVDTDLSGLKDFSFKGADGKDVSVTPKMIRAKVGGQEGYFVHPEGHPLANPDVQKALQDLNYNNERSKFMEARNRATERRMQNDSLRLAVLLNSKTQITDDMFRNAGRIIDDAWKRVPFDKQLDGADPLAYLDGEARSDYEQATALRQAYLFQKNGDFNDIVQQARDLSVGFDKFRDRPAAGAARTPGAPPSVQAPPTAPAASSSFTIRDRSFATPDEAKIFLRDEIKKLPAGAPFPPDLYDAYSQLRGR